MLKKIAVAGAGTMGNGIALASAGSGYEVILYDNFPGALDKGKQAIKKNIDFLLNKQKLTQEEAVEIHKRITYSEQINDCKADLVIEAIIEKPEIKIRLFQELASINTPSTILASNTSSLSINQIQKNIEYPERFAGLHFFNPANLMKLVEVVKGEKTSETIINQLTEFCKSLNKVPVICNDAPGFIVNRVARHFYLESLRLVEHEGANPELVDAVLENAGFKMGPFKLMDLIGMDINYAVSQSLYEALNKPERLKPSDIQGKKVAEGKLGRKTGEGFYNYTSQAPA